MKPVLILQHLSGDGPAYLAEWLGRRGLPMEVRNTEAGEAFPDTLAGFGALAILGGEMSANDDLPSLRQAEALFLQALGQGVPTLGHCLGGQLMARALGARIGPSPAPEVGFHRLRVHNGASASAWFGAAPAPAVYQWHYETFELPGGAQWLAASDACPHQAFALGPGAGLHLAMQFHIELDEAKLHRWSLDEGPLFRDALARHATVHSGERMRADAAALMAQHKALADRIYERWFSLAAAF